MLGKLIREVQPELMDVLIQATKDGGDQSRLQALSGSVLIGEDDEAEESKYEEEEEVPYHIL